jgi:hypothetical protein
MQFQFNSDNRVSGDAAVAEQLEALVRGRLSRIADHLSRVEIHVGDVNGPRGDGDDKRCAVEVRPNGMKPISATDQASSVEAAVTSATNKVLAAYDRQIGKQTTRKGH